MGGSRCKYCHVETVSRDHYKAHQKWETELLHYLEATEDTGEGTFGNILRMQIKLREDQKAGRVSEEEYEARTLEIEMATLKYIEPVPSSDPNAAGLRRIMTTAGALLKGGVN